MYCPFGRHLINYFYQGAMLALKDQLGNTPLHCTILGHRDDMVSMLVQNNVDASIINQG